MSKKAVVLLSQSCTSLSLMPQDSWTALMIAAKIGDLEVVKLLLSSQTNVDATNRVSIGITIGEE